MPRLRLLLSRARPWTGLVLVAATLVVLRLVALRQGGNWWRTLFLDARENALGLPVHFSVLVLSLSFEAFVLLCAAAILHAGAAGRWVARGLVLSLLTVNALGTYAFFVLGTRVQGFHFVGLTFRQMGAVLASFVGLPMISAFVALVGAALLFGREGSVERRRPARRTAASLGALMLVSLAATSRLVASPEAFSLDSQSPATLLMVGSLPADLVGAPRGAAALEDWAPPDGLAPQWEGLAAGHRPRNVVVAVLESVRAQSLWPSPDAPAMPRLAALEPRSVVFTRAYAQEPVSIISLESMLLGMYGLPSWESVSARRPGVAFESFADRWRELGMRTAFLQNGDVHFASQKPLLEAHGFDLIEGDAALEGYGPKGSDLALVKRLDAFISESPEQPFGVMLWPMGPHAPYKLQPPRVNKAPLNSYEAYRETLEQLDDFIGELADLLERRGLAESTVLVLVGDHGQVFGERQGDVFRGSSVHDLALRVPLVFINPVLFHGDRDERIVQLKDVGATLSWLAGDARPTLNAGTAVFFQKPSETAYLVNFFQGRRYVVGAVRGRHKYVYTHGDVEHPATEVLFDLDVDPGETTDVSALHPEERESLRRRAFGWLHFWRERWERVDLRRDELDRQAATEAMFGTPPAAAPRLPQEAGIPAIAGP